MVTIRQCRFLKDKEGRPLNLENVIIENNVNTQKVGLYFVTFRYESYLSIAKVYVNPTNFAAEGICLQSFLIVKQ